MRRSLASSGLFSYVVTTSRSLTPTMSFGTRSGGTGIRLGGRESKAAKSRSPLADAQVPLAKIVRGVMLPAGGEDLARPEPSVSERLDEVG